MLVYDKELDFNVLPQYEENLSDYNITSYNPDTKVKRDAGLDHTIYWLINRWGTKISRDSRRGPGSIIEINIDEETFSKLSTLSKSDHRGISLNLDLAYGEFIIGRKVQEYDIDIECPIPFIVYDHFKRVLINDIYDKE